MREWFLDLQSLDSSKQVPRGVASTAGRPLIVALAFLLFLLSASGILVTVRLALSGHVDFRQLYTAGYMVRAGSAAQLYNYAEVEKLQNLVVSPADGALPFNHLAYESLLYAPLSFFRYPVAYVIFLGFNLLLLAAGFRMLRPYLSPLCEVWFLLPASLFVCFLPVAMALTEGQDSILMLALFIAATVALDRERDFTAGVLVGLTLFKFQYAIPVALLFVAWRRWRFTAGFAFAAAALAGLSLSLTGIGAFFFYLHSLLEMSAKFSPSHGVQYGIRPELMPNLRGLVYAAVPESPLTVHVAIGVLSAFVMLWTVRRRPSLPVALLAALLVSYHQFITDATLLLLPLGTALAAALSARNRRAVYVVSLAGFVLVAPALLLLAGARFHLLAIPALALLAVWDGSIVNPEPAVHHGLVHEKNETTLARTPAKVTVISPASSAPPKPANVHKGERFWTSLQWLVERKSKIYR
jgi:hypothetical protein